jgi:hypothetical protein
VALRTFVRSCAASLGALLATWACYAVYAKIQTYRYARSIDILPKFPIKDEILEWSAIVVMSLGSAFLIRFAYKFQSHS